MTPLTEEQQRRVQSLVDKLSGPDFVCDCKERLCIHWQVYAIKLLSPLLDSDSQAANDVAKERDEWKLLAGECMEGISASHRLLDEFGVPREDAWLHETDGENYGIEEVTEYPVHERIKMLPPFAATRMRDKCVEKVKAMRDEWDSAKANYVPGDAFRTGLTIKAVAALEVINELESLTLDQEQEKL